MYQNLNLYLAIPCYGGNVTSGTFQSVLALVGWCYEKKINLKVQTLYNEALISRARNTLVAMMLDDEKFNASHLLFIDSDIKFEINNIERLFKINKDIVCGCYAQKQIFWDKVIDTVNNNPEVKNNYQDLISQSLNYNFNLDAEKIPNIVDGYTKVVDAATGTDKSVVVPVGVTTTEPSVEVIDCIAVSQIACSASVGIEYPLA
jgi:hypothetical protein